MDISTLSTAAVRNSGLRRRCTVLAAAALTALSLAGLPAQADTYRWVDDDGVVNYAERKPRNVPEERVTRIADASSRRQSAAPQSTPAPAPAIAERTSAERSNVPLNPSQKNLMQDLEAAEQARQEQIAKIRQDNCDRSRRVLNNLTAKTRIRVRAEDGTERALDEDERQERITAAQRGIAENCEA